MSRELFEALGPITEPMRRIRFLSDDDLGELTPEEVEVAVRSLRGLSYSANEGARRLEKYAQREEP